MFDIIKSHHLTKKVFSLGKFSDQFYEENQDKISLHNYKSAKWLALCGGIGTLLIALFLFFVLGRNNGAIICYLGATVSLFIYEIILIKCRNRGNVFSTTILYLELGCILLASLLSGSIFSPNDYATSFILLIGMSPCLIFDKHLRASVTFDLYALLFIILCCISKPFTLASIDIFNVVVTGIMGNMLFRYILDVKIKSIENAKKQLAALENKYQLELMISQIQPHFLYNTLSSIQYLCLSDPQTAAKVTNKFAKYLRTSVEYEKFDQPKKFDVVLNQIENYLYIEQLRYGDRLKIEYSLETKDFYMPLLSLQPIVENAIKHGIAKKENGGTVKISTHHDKENKQYLISVEDDGVGFDVSNVNYDDDSPDKGRIHIGLKNVEKRIQLMSNGKLSIYSKPGIGTKVIISIPETVKGS